MTDTDAYVALVQNFPPDGGFMLQFSNDQDAGSLESRIAVLVEFAHSRPKDQAFGWAIARVEMSGQVRAK